MALSVAAPSDDNCVMQGQQRSRTEGDRTAEGDFATRFPNQMKPSDAVMWDIEKDPVLRSTITAVAMLDREPDWDRFVERIDRASRLIPRLRQRVVIPPLRLATPRWVLDENFDLGYHVRRVRAPAPGGLREVLDVAQPIAMAPFDRARPLWEFTLVEGLDGGGAALIQKLHHSLTDGVGAVELALLMLDSERDPVEAVTMPDPPRLDRPGAVVSVSATAGDMLSWWARSMVRIPTTALSAAVSTVRKPVGTATATRDLVVSAAKVLAPMSAPEQEVLHTRTLARRFHIIEIPLAELKEAGRAASGTVNDAFLAAVIEGLRRYHRLQGAEVDELRVTMPVSLRQAGDDLGGNRFAPARFAVPANIDDPIVRMRRLGQIARDWQHEPALELTESLAYVLDRLPVRVTTALFGSMLKHIDTVVTNVPGLPARAYLAGAEVVREYAFAPTAGAAVNVALVSHCDLACIGIVVDTGAVSDEEQLVQSIVDGFADVVSVGGSASAKKASAKKASAKKVAASAKKASAKKAPAKKAPASAKKAPASAKKAPAKKGRARPNGAA